MADFETIAMNTTAAKIETAANTIKTDQGLNRYLNGSGAYTEILDYIVEQGTSDGWTYRKWANGTVECWCSYTANILITYTWGNVLFSGDNIGKALPTCVLTSEPIACFASINHMFCWPGQTQIYGRLVYFRPLSISTIQPAVSAGICFSVKGRWK